MKKLKLNPLSLDKETIALLDFKQLKEIVGGRSIALQGTSTGCGTGGSGCNSSVAGGSSGCGSGGSTCGASDQLAAFE